MSRSNLTRTLRNTVCTLALGAAAAATAGCGVEVGPAYPVGGYDEYPPDAYIATTEPVYYEGNASYWYGGRWYYRNGGRWNHYGREPAGLYESRMRAAPARRSYESRGGHSGGRGRR